MGPVSGAHGRGDPGAVPDLRHGALLPQARHGDLRLPPRAPPRRPHPADAEGRVGAGEPGPLPLQQRRRLDPHHRRHADHLAAGRLRVLVHALPATGLPLLRRAGHAAGAGGGHDPGQHRHHQVARVDRLVPGSDRPLPGRGLRGVPAPSGVPHRPQGPAGGGGARRPRPLRLPPRGGGAPGAADARRAGALLVPGGVEPVPVAAAHHQRSRLPDGADRPAVVVERQPGPAHAHHRGDRHRRGADRDRAHRVPAPAHPRSRPPAR